MLALAFIEKLIMEFASLGSKPKLQKEGIYLLDILIMKELGIEETKTS